MEHCYGDFVSPETIADWNHIWIFSIDFKGVYNTKFHENLSSRNHDDISKQRDGWKD